MASKKEINEFLEENGLTILEIDEMWENCKSTNSTIKQLVACGKNWDDLNIHVIKKLPTQKQRDVEQISELKLKEQQIKEKNMEKEYYEENFKEIMYKKIINGEKLTEDELKDVALEFGDYVDGIEGEKHRWYIETKTIIDVNGQLFAIDWEKGLTENQENTFYKQPYKIKKTVKVMETTEYIKE